MENQNDILKRVRLLMEYDMSMTYSENLVLISEQPDSKMPFQPERFGYKQGKPETVKPALEKQSKAIKTFIVDAPTISEVLSKAREFLFTPEGMTAQLILSIAGAEIGLPVVFGILDIAILINDIIIMIQNWKPKQFTDEESWFTFHWENNKGFQFVIEDIILLLTGGLLSLAGKGARYVYGVIKKRFSKGITEIVEQSEQIIINKEPYIKKLPKKISDWALSKLNQLKKGIELLKSPKSAAKSIVKKSPLALGLGAANYKFLKWLDGKTEKAKELDQNNIMSLTDIEAMSYIAADNPNLFKIEVQGDRSTGDYWDYKRDLDGNFYAKNTKKNGNWLLAKGKPLDAIKSKFENEVYPNYKFNSFKMDKKNKQYIIDGKKYQAIKPSFKVKPI